MMMEDVLQDPPTSIDRANGDTIDGAKTSNVIDSAFYSLSRDSLVTTLKSS